MNKFKGMVYWNLLHAKQRKAYAWQCFLGFSFVSHSCVTPMLSNNGNVSLLLFGTYGEFAVHLDFDISIWYHLNKQNTY